MNNKNDRLEKMVKEVKGNANVGVRLAIFGAILIALMLVLQFATGVKNSNNASKPAAQSATMPGFAVSNDCEIVIRYKDRVEHRKADGSPLVITREMEDALIFEPLGTANDFTASGIGAKKVVLNNYDNTAFNYARLQDGFRLTVKKDIPEGRARTTDISVDDKPFWLEFAFGKACE